MLLLLKAFGLDFFFLMMFWFESMKKCSYFRIGRAKQHGNCMINEAYPDSRLCDDLFFSEKVFSRVY